MLLNLINVSDMRTPVDAFIRVIKGFVNNVYIALLIAA